jgi:hypothetical protein
VDDGIGRGADFANAFDEALHRRLIHAAEGPEAGGVGVAIEGVAAAKSIMGNDGGGAAPVEPAFGWGSRCRVKNVAFDGRALGMAANGAHAGVARGLAQRLRGRSLSANSEISDSFIFLRDFCLGSSVNREARIFKT